MNKQAVEKTKERIKEILNKNEHDDWFDTSEAIEQLSSLIDEEKAKAYQSGMSKGYINGRTSLQEALKVEQEK